jgi:CRISPR-associated protein Cmr5
MKQAVIESGRAEFALNRVKSMVKNPNDKTKKEYKSYAKRFPSLVLSNGLAATVAFALEKGGAWEDLYKDVSEWLIKNGYFASPTRLEEYVCSLNSDEYRAVTKEVLSLFEWLRRFASGLIEGEADA